MYQIVFTDPTIYIENHKTQVGLQQASGNKNVHKYSRETCME
jgi:uncharacterized protein YigE (DUF2233 family)